MKVIQLNIWLGHLLHPALTFIKSEDPDFLCVQEVFSSKKSVPLFGEYQTHQHLSELFPYRSFAPTFSFQALGETIEYGNAIYSKFPIMDESVDFTHGAYAPNQSFSAFEHNIRNIHWCKIALPNGKSLTIANHHGYHELNDSGSDNSVASMQQAAESLKAANAPLVFCGDLNVNPASRALRELDILQLRNMSTGSNLTTTLSDVHRLDLDIACDYIFVSPEITTGDFSVAEALVSDHKALVLHFDV